MRRLFLVNPSTKGGSLSHTEQWFRDRGCLFDLAITTSRRDVIERTRNALRNGVDQVVALGGDGTVNAVANGFVDEEGAIIAPRAQLAVAPWGTGCDYYRTVGYRQDWREAVLAAQSVPVDLGRIRSAAGTTHFVNAMSLGLSAEVVKRQRHMPRWMPTLATYSLPALTGLLAYRPQALTVLLDGKKYEGDFLSVFFAKGNFLGGGMRFGGNVSLDDGRFDVTLLHGMTLAQSLPRFGKIFTGRFHGDPKITKTTAREISISAATAQPIEFDGELEGTTDVEVSVLPRAINVCR